LPDDDAVLVRPLTVSTCDFDGLVIQGLIPFPGPKPIGHEGEGVVVDVGDRVTRYKPGDRVIIPWKIACGSCPSCRRKHTAQCSSVPPAESYGWGLNSALWGGFLSDLVVVPWADHMLTRLPPDVDPSMACGVADNISDGWRAVAPGLRERPGGTVLVIGMAPPGSIGLYAAGIAVALGAERVVYADRDPARLAIAERMGAEAFDLRCRKLETLKEDLKGVLGGFDITVDAAGEAAMLPTLLHLTAPAGVCTSTAGVRYRGKGDVPLPITKMYLKSVSFHTGWVHTHAIIDEPLELIRSGRFDPSPVVSRTVDWSDAIDALVEPFTKVIVRRDS
jgi:alcohol dehydrogenase